MGMTIEDSIEIINHYLDYPKEEVRKALLVAINTMCKYKKIEQIIKDIPYGSEATVRRIQEVVEDATN